MQPVGKLPEPLNAPVPPESAAALDGFCAAIAALTGPKPHINRDALLAGLDTVHGLHRSLLESNLPSACSHWRATYVELPLSYGGLLTLSDPDRGVQELSFRFGVDAAVQLATWRSLTSNPDAPCAIFGVRQGASGSELWISDGLHEIPFVLGPAVGSLAWAQASNVATGPTSQAVPNAERVCRQCGKGNPPENSFCGSCGSRLREDVRLDSIGVLRAGERRCSNPQCGRTVRLGENFCPSCGTRVS